MTSTASFTGTGIFAEAKQVTNGYAEVPPEIAANLAGSLAYFAVRNTNKLSVGSPQIPDADAADLLRRQIKTWADSHGMAATFPEYVPEHMTKDVTDPKTGKITNPAHLVPANKVDKGSNKGTNVTFRLAKPSVKATTDTQTVTSTQAAK